MKLTIVLCLVIALLLVGCGHAEADPVIPPEITEVPDAQITAAADAAAETTEISDIAATYAAESSEGESEMEKQLTLMINDTVIPVFWEDNESVHALMEQAALDSIHVTLDPYGGWEQVGSLGRSYPRNDVQQTAENGDIMLYSGNQIVLFYGNNSWAYTKLGHMDLPAQDVTALLSGSSISITITFA